MRRLGEAVVITICLVALAGSRGPSHPDPPRPVINDPNVASSWADSVLATMSIEQKIGQLFVVAGTGALYNEQDDEYRLLVDLVERFQIGGVVFFRGDPLAQAMLTNDLQRRSKIPLLISQDMEWGVGMRLGATTEFPKAMALGATRNPGLAYAMGRVVAAEARSLGIHINLAPVADINNNPGNPVINVRSFGEDPELVGSLATAYSRGLQDGGLIATAKHFPGHGDTDVDSHSGLPVLPISRARLDSLELVPFAQAIESGIGSIMIAHISLPEIEGASGIPATLSSPIVTEILREDLGFDGLIVTDAMRMHGITDDFGSGEAALRSLNAGVDQILIPKDFYAARRAILHGLTVGEISMDRIDQAVRRILVAKATVGLDSYEPVDLVSIQKVVADPAASALALEMARQGVTLLNTREGLVPLPKTDIRILDITLSDSDVSSRGLSFDRKLRRYAPEAEITRLLLDSRSHESEYEQALLTAANYDAVVLQSYVIVRSGSGKIKLDQQKKRFLNDLIGADVPVVLVAFGSPYLIMGIDQPDALIAAYGSSDATTQAVAQALTGQIGFSGKLPVSIPGLYSFGDGLSTDPSSIRFDTPENVGMNSAILAELDTLLWNAIEDTAFPAAAVSVGRAGVIAMTDGFGYLTYESEVQITSKSLFDLASITKVAATTPAIMLLYDRGLIDLDEPLATYLPEFGAAGKDSVTVRQILTHTAGLAPFYSFEHMGITSRNGIFDFIAADSLIHEPDTRYRYSDLGMMMLALTVERITDQEIGDFLAENLYEPLGMHDTGFRPAGGRGIDPTVVPTELDTLLRMRLVQGEVHDERAWMVGGTAGHA
jgi:beta-N-acetylhexosaminidase